MCGHGLGDVGRQHGEYGVCGYAGYAQTSGMQGGGYKGVRVTKD